MTTHVHSSFCRKGILVLLEAVQFCTVVAAVASLLIGLLLSGVGQGMGVAWLVMAGVFTAAAVPLHVLLHRRNAELLRHIDGFSSGETEEEPRA